MYMRWGSKEMALRALAMSRAVCSTALTMVGDVGEELARDVGSGATSTDGNEVMIERSRDAKQLAKQLDQQIGIVVNRQRAQVRFRRRCRFRAVNRPVSL